MPTKDQTPKTSNAHGGAKVGNSKSAPHDCPFADYVPAQQAAAAVDPKFEARLGIVEGAVETIGQDVKSLASRMDSNVQALGHEVGSLRDTIADKIESVMNRVGTETKPRWPLILSFGGIVITLLGLAGSIVGLGFTGLGSSVAEVKATQSALQERLFQAQYEKGRSDAFISQATSQIRELDEKLQREMTLINATTEARVKALDEKLQIEFIGMHRLSESQLKVNTEAIANIKDWRLEYVAKDAEASGRVVAKQLMIEEGMRRLEERQNGYRADRLKSYEALETEKVMKP